MTKTCPDQQFLDEIFPPERTDSFFEALYGGAEEGAYDIRLGCIDVSDNIARMAFELHGRPGKCLRCNLTYGLPEVFARHPVINAAGLAQKIAAQLGWGDDITWKTGRTEEKSPDLHIVPFLIERRL